MFFVVTLVIRIFFECVFIPFTYIFFFFKISDAFHESFVLNLQSYVWFTEVSVLVLNGLVPMKRKWNETISLTKGTLTDHVVCLFLLFYVINSHCVAIVCT